MIKTTMVAAAFVGVSGTAMLAESTTNTMNMAAYCEHYVEFAELIMTHRQDGGWASDLIKAWTSEDMDLPESTMLLLSAMTT